MSNLSEKDIFGGIAEGNERVISDFYKENLPKITRFILKNSGNKADAEDVFQDALVIIHQKLKTNSLQLECSLGTYVFAVCRNLWMNVLRKRKKIQLKEEFSDTPDRLNASIIETLKNKDKQLLYQKHFLRLGESCQNILLHFFSGKSMVNISQLMGYSEKYTRKKKFECKKRLIEMIEEDPIYSELNTKSNKTKSA